MPLPSQVLLRYDFESWSPCLDGIFVEFEIQAGGPSWRPPRNGADLQDARAALQDRGYSVRRTVLHAGTQDSSSNPTVHLDTWILRRPAAQPKTEPPPAKAEAPSTDAATPARSHDTLEPVGEQLRILAGF